MRRLILLVVAAVAVYVVVTRRRPRETVTLGYRDGSSLSLADDAPGTAAIRAAAKGVLRA